MDRGVALAVEHADLPAGVRRVVRGLYVEQQDKLYREIFTELGMVKGKPAP